jgi:anaerobic carbon-monoxide dehydrogenase iron sulfur subunit
MILDVHPELCTGCMLCELYCSLAHEGQSFPELSRIQILAEHNRKKLVPVLCVPCEENPCLAACPEPGAIHKTASGAVVIEEILCTACGKCAHACQIGAIQIHRLEGRGKNGKAVALKCDQCQGDPWCVKVCPVNAILKVEGRIGDPIVFNRILSARQELEISEKHS